MHSSHDAVRGRSQLCTCQLSDVYRHRWNSSRARHQGSRTRRNNSWCKQCRPIRNLLWFREEDTTVQGRVNKQTGKQRW